jgi:hypothetical protein
MNPLIKKFAGIGGKTRAEKLSPERRKAIAAAAAAKRWANKREADKQPEPAKPEPEPVKPEPERKQDTPPNPLAGTFWSDRDNPGPLERDKVFQALLKQRKREGGGWCRPY